MKKLVSLLLALIFLTQSMPVNALAEALYPAPTAQELTAAVALTGLDSSAPGYRSGMVPSTTMNAFQLSGWIKEFQDQKLAYIMDIFENYDVELAYIKEKYPVSFDMLLSFHETGIGRFYDEYNEAMAWQDDVNHYRDRLNTLANEIYVLAEYFQEEDTTEREQVIYAYEIRNKWQALENLIPEIVDRTEMWSAEYDRLEKLLAGPYAYSGDPDSLSWLLDVVDNLRLSNGQATLKEATVSASAVRVQQDQTMLTRLARLSPISSALADSDQSMQVKIIDDKYFYVKAVDGSTLLEGASITAADYGKSSAKTELTDAAGYAAFAVSDFQNDKKGYSTVNITAQFDGYRRVEASKIKIMKGSQMSVPMVKDDGAPYPVSFSFWDHDVLLADYTVVNSPFNDTQQTFSAKIKANGSYDVRIYALYKKNGKTEEFPIGDGKGGKGEQAFNFSGRWLMNLPADCKLYLTIDQGGKSYTYKGNLVVKKSKVEDPIGSPDVGNVLNFGLGFKLPNSWPSPLGGLEISIDLPIEKKYQFQLYVDLNGAGMFSFGTKAFEDKMRSINDGIWKSEDQEDLDEDIEDAESDGYFAKTLAANGGDWAGRKKWKPMTLGKFSLEMAWFAFAQVQYREDDNYYGQWLGKGGGGFTATFKGEFALMWPIASLSFYASATFSMWPELAVAIDTYWPNHKGIPQFRHFDYAMANLNIVIRIEIGVIATLGVKGIAGLSIIGSVYIQFAFQFSLGLDFATWLRKKADGGSGGLFNADVDLTISVGGGVSVMLQILFVKVRKTLVDSGDRVIYTSKKDKASLPETLVDRFVAFLVSPARAETQTAATELGKDGGQLDTRNSDLILNGQEVASDGFGEKKMKLFTMRPLNSSTPEPVALYIDASFKGAPRPMLVSVAGMKTGKSFHYTALECYNGQPGDQEDHFTAEDGYDVIDFDYWVADVADQGLTSKPQGSKALPLKDVLFTVCLLAKDYHDEQKVLDDGSTETIRVPNETWAYVRCWCLYGNEITPVILPDEEADYNYLALCYPLREYNEKCPSGEPRIVGMVRTRYDRTLYQYEVVTNPLSVDGREKSGYFIGEVAYADDSYKRRLSESKKERVARTTAHNNFMWGRQFYDYQFVAGDYDYFFHLYLAGAIGKESDFYDLAFGFDEVTYGLFVPLILMDTGKCIMSNVASFATRKGSATKPHLFVVQQSEDGEGCRLMGCKIGDLFASASQINWTVKDYDIDMPRANIHWMKVCGRECVYWMESAGQTEDGTGNLFKVWAVWYDDIADAMSEPFVLATVETPTKDGVPTEMYLTGNTEGYYFVCRENSETQLYKFTFQLVAGLKLIGNVLTETLANVGSYDDMLVTVYNNGNAPLTGFDLAAYHYTDSSQTGETFETIHVDLLNPSRSSITIPKKKIVIKYYIVPWIETVKETIYGENIARAETSSLSMAGDEYRYMTQRRYYKYIYDEAKLMEETQELMKPALLMPGTFAVYKISLLIPGKWEGDHHMYMEVDRYYVSDGTSFQKDVSQASGGVLLSGAQPQNSVVSIGRDGTVRRENSGGMLMAARSGEDGNADEDFSIYKTDVGFDRIGLDTSAEDLQIKASRWDNAGTPMVTLVVTNRASNGKGASNTVVMEAFLDDETTPVFRYSLPEEVSDKATWNFELPLSLLTDGRSASKVTVTVKGKNYTETGEHNNSAVFLLDTEALSFLVNPESLEVPEGSEAVFRGAAYGGRMPYKYQWQVKTPKGSWRNLEGETSDTLTLRAVTKEMNDNQYQLTVTDASGNSAASNAAVLRIKGVPHTGDTTPILWYALGILAAGSVIVWMLRKKKENR